MGVQTLKRKMWLALFEKRTAHPEMTVRQFCEANNVTEKSYWYFHKILADELEEELFPAAIQTQAPAFLELKKEDLYPSSCEDKKAVRIALADGRVSLYIDEKISDDFLFRILRAVDHV